MATSPDAPNEADSAELDPELINLPRPKTRIRPIMAMAIIGICLTIGVRLGSDLLFSRKGEPIVVDGVSELSSDLENEYIELTLRPDRVQALRVLPSRSTSGHVLMPTLGTGGKVWVLLSETAWGADGDTSERYRGRLSRLSDMSFADTLRSHVKKGTVAMRPIALDEIRRAIGEKSSEVADVSGDRFVLSAATDVHIAETATDRVRLLAVSSEPYVDEASWSFALESAGLLPQGTAPVSTTPTSWTFDVPAPNGLAGVTATLREAKLFAAKASEIRNTREGTWGELSLDGGDVLLGKARPGFRTLSVAVRAAPVVGSGAYLLDTTEKPGDYWYVIIIVLGLFAIALVFAAALAQAIRRR